MSLAIQPYRSTEHGSFSKLAEDIILRLGDAFDIRIVWDGDTAVLTGVCAVAGGLLGGYMGGRMGAALGAGISGAVGLGVSTVISLRELWSKIKDKLEELMYIVLNFLRRLDAVDYINAAEILMASYSSKKELVISIMSFIGYKLGSEVLSSLTHH